FWMQTAAGKHSAANGWPVSRYREHGVGWFARHNSIDYLRQVFLGDEIVVRTWIASSTRATSLRRYALWRRSDGKLVATGKTDWAFVNTATGRPQKILPELSECFEEIPGDEPLAEFLVPRPADQPS
ncbi:MAG TPA: acyl-CoA thioesterase, partial [Pirellulales bacterium]